MIEDLKREEGFRGEPYDDHLGNPTIGYGTKLPLTEEEAEVLLLYRLQNFKYELMAKIPFWLNLSENQKDALSQMAYQMGVSGLLKFKKTLRFLELGDGENAYKEALNSRWAKQTPSRAERVAQLLRG